ncbi:MAG: TolC family protein [Bryobacteraceae bacterium]|nr:TolC family protein [Bryobacteraceae bacterium]MDW8378414.1 TolC family protein [Bryobacterales bacterium]
MTQIILLVFLACAVTGGQPGWAQSPSAVPSPVPNSGSRWSFEGLRQRLQHYKVQEIPPINLRNSTRLESLLRAGRIYLSLQDAIALALENNLDIEIQRYGPRLAEAELMRAQAGGFIRGIPTSLNTNTTAVASSVTGGGGLGTFQARGGGGGDTGTTSAGGFVFTQSGTAIPQLDPVVFVGYGYNHRSSINANSFATGVPATVINNQSPFFGIQKGFLTGTNVSLDFNTSHVRTNIPRAEINPFFTGNLGLTITQNLLRGFGRAVNNRFIRIAKNEMTVADLVFKQQVIVTVSNIINIYWDLVSFSEDVKVRKQALALAEKLLSDNKKQVEIGTLAPIEIVRAEAEVARNQQDLTVAETRLLQQETILKNALSRTGVSSPLLADARIVPTDSLRIPDQDEIRPIQDLVNTALQTRPDVEQTRLSIESTKIGLEGSKSQLLPQLDLTLSTRHNGLAGAVNTIPIPGLPPEFGFVQQANPYFLGGYGSVLRQIFARNFPDYSIGFQLSIPINNRQARADMANDLLRLRQQELRQQAQINQIRVDVQNALIALQQARASYQAANKSRIFAEQTLDAEQKKYALGASTIFFVIQAQRDLAVAQGAEVAALASYARARVALDQALGATLEVNHISIEEARKGQVSRPPSPLP